MREWFDDAESSATAPATDPVPLIEKPLVPLAALPTVRKRFRNAWVLMDRIHDADDNGERLFRYLRENRPDINAWFVLEKGTPDWKRMVRDGYRSRMVAHGTHRWRMLMLNCAHLISSHADAPIHNPAGVARRNRATWNITFLQHGVIKDDLSRWLNPKAIDLFVTSTPQEQASIVADGTTYNFTSKEARMTGLPRFDRLRELGAHVPVEKRRWLLVCPTWRQWLIPPPKPGTQRSTVDDSFFDSEYAHEWTAFLSDPGLAALAAEHDLQIGFLPHPNIQPALARMHLPSHVHALTFADNDVQQLFAESAVMVTDYSSMFFNAAYLDRPVVYFQFDGKQVLQGAHTGRPGYFEYDRDGFGPVTSTVLDTVAAIDKIVTEDKCVPNAEYQRRINEAFPERDGLCCERTTAAIEDLSPKLLPPDRIGEALKRLRANPHVQKVVRSQRGRALVPKVKQLAKARGVDKLLK